MPATDTHSQPVDLWSQAGFLRRRIADAARLFLFLDFDGTLAPIVPEPSSARMPEALKRILESLCARSDVVAAVITGRAVEDLVPRVGLPVIYAGNHGLEIHGRGLEYAAPVPAQTVLQLVDCCKALRVRLAPVNGAWIEYKEWTAAVHVRQVARCQVPDVAHFVRTTVMEYPNLKLSSGKEVFEVQPNIAWNKGHAARWILHQMEGNESDAICLGDDSTDEDMFHALRGGISIKIGAGDSSAQYRLADTEVLRFFSFVWEAVERSRGSHINVESLTISR